MSDERARAERLAAEAIPLDDWDEYHQEPVDNYGYPETERQGFVKGYLTAKAEPVTVSAEQVEAVAYAIDPYPWDDFMRCDMQRTFGEIGSPARKRQERARESARAALRAAGLRIEGDDHD